MPPPAGPTVYEEGKEGLRVGKSCFGQGKEEAEVKNILGILSQNGRFLSEKTKQNQLTTLTVYRFF